METKTISIKRCFGKGWEAFKINPVPAIFGFFLFTIIKVVGQNIPFLGIGFVMFLAAPFTGGMAILMLNLVNNEKPAIENIFSGFKKYGQFMGVYWLLIVILALSALPFGLGALTCTLLEPMQFQAFDRGNEALASTLDTLILVIILLAVAISVILYIALLLKWFFVYFIIADSENEDTVIDAFKRSSKMTKGNRIRLLLAAFVLALFSISGVIGLGIGIFVTAPIAGCGMASIYNELKASYASGDQSD